MAWPQQIAPAAEPLSPNQWQAQYVGDYPFGRSSVAKAIMVDPTTAGGAGKNGFTVVRPATGPGYTTNQRTGGGWVAGSVLNAGTATHAGGTLAGGVWTFNKLVVFGGVNWDNVKVRARYLIVANRLLDPTLTGGYNPKTIGEYIAMDHWSPDRPPVHLLEGKDFFDASNGCELDIEEAVFLGVVGGYNQFSSGAGEYGGAAQVTIGGGVTSFTITVKQKSSLAAGFRNVTSPVINAPFNLQKINTALDQMTFTPDNVLQNPGASGMNPGIVAFGIAPGKITQDTAPISDVTIDFNDQLTVLDVTTGTAGVTITNVHSNMGNLGGINCGNAISLARDGADPRAGYPSGLHRWECKWRASDLIKWTSNPQPGTANEKDFTLWHYTDHGLHPDRDTAFGGGHMDQHQLGQQATSMTKTKLALHRFFFWSMNNAGLFLQTPQGLQKYIIARQGLIRFRDKGAKPMDLSGNLTQVAGFTNVYVDQYARDAFNETLKPGNIKASNGDYLSISQMSTPANGGGYVHDTYMRYDYPTNAWVAVPKKANNIPEPNDMVNPAMAVENATAGTTIISFNPTTGAAGTPVDIVGTNFTGTTAVRFNGVNAAFDPPSDDSNVTAYVPATATTGPITVVAATTAQSAGNFTIATGTSPTITNIAPTSGNVGDKITVTGTNLLGGTFKFNGTPARVVATRVLNSATVPVIIVPAGAITGTITVDTGAGSAASASFTVTVPTVAPDATSYLPITGAPGTEITITGAHFEGLSKVEFAGPSSTFVEATRTVVDIGAGFDVASGWLQAKQQAAVTEALILDTDYPWYTRPATAAQKNNWRFSTTAQTFYAGFWPGQFFKIWANDKTKTNWKTQAINHAAAIRTGQTTWNTMDIGFLFVSSLLEGLKYLDPVGDAATITAYKTAIQTAADTLSARWVPLAASRGVIRATQPGADTDVNPWTIVDTLPSMELLVQSWILDNAKTVNRTRAVTHAQTLMNTIGRTTGVAAGTGGTSVASRFQYSAATGNIIAYDAGPGADTTVNSAWARGQSWAMFGFIRLYQLLTGMAGTHTDGQTYANIAQQFQIYACSVADFYVAKLPADRVPYYDFLFTATNPDSRDSSSAAIAASALMKMAASLPLNDSRRTTYRNVAGQILTQLMSNTYRGSANNDPAIITKGRGPESQLPDSDEKGLAWGDYYIIEAFQDWESFPHTVKALVPATAIDGSIRVTTPAGTDTIAGFDVITTGGGGGGVTPTVDAVSSDTASSASNQFVITLPAASATNTVIIGVFYKGGIADAISTITSGPTGWTWVVDEDRQGTDIGNTRLAVIRGTGTPAFAAGATLQVNFLTAAPARKGALIHVCGQIDAAPRDTGATAVASGATSTAWSITGSVRAAVNELLLTFLVADAGTLTAEDITSPGSPWVPSGEIASVGASANRQGAAMYQIPADTTAKTASGTFAAAHSWYAVQVAYKAAAFAPTPTITSFNPTSGREGMFIDVVGTNFAGATVVSFNNVPCTRYTVVDAQHITAVVPVGASTGAIRVTANGLTGLSASNFTVLAPIATSFTSFVPSHAFVGEPVTILGTNFGNVDTVKFNGMIIPFTVVDYNTITTTVPIGATTGTVTVQVGAVTTTSGTFTVDVPGVVPTITSFNPQAGRLGQTIVITGTNLDTTVLVEFNGQRAGFIVLDASHVRTIVPYGATTGPIRITTLTGSATT